MRCLYSCFCINQPLCFAVIEQLVVCSDAKNRLGAVGYIRQTQFFIQVTFEYFPDAVVADFKALNDRFSNTFFV